MNQNKKVINSAIDYAKSTNGIENLNLTKEELKKIKETLIGEKKYESLLFDIVSKLNEKESENKNVRLR